MKLKEPTVEETARLVKSMGPTCRDFLEELRGRPAVSS